MARSFKPWFMTAAALASLCAIGLGPRDAEACSCRPSPSAEAALAASDAVFEARVAAAPAPPPQTGAGVASTGGEVTVTATVLRSWKGVGLDAGREIKIATPNGSATCGYTFQANESYVVFATKTTAGVLATNICMRTKRSSDAADDITALNNAGSAPAPTTAPPTASSAPGEEPPFEANPGVPVVASSAPPPPSKTAPPQKTAKGGGCAGCALIERDEGSAGPSSGLAAAMFALVALGLRRRRSSLSS